MVSPLLAVKPFPHQPPGSMVEIWTIVALPVVLRSIFQYLYLGHYSLLVTAMRYRAMEKLQALGIEISFDVQFTVHLQKGKRINWPRGENKDYIFTLGNARPLRPMRATCNH